MLLLFELCVLLVLGQLCSILLFLELIVSEPIVAELSGQGGPAVEGVGASSVELIALPLSIVTVSVCKGQHSLSVLEVVLVLSAVEVSGGVVVGASSVFDAVEEVSFVVVSVGVGVESVPVRLVEAEVSGVACAVLEVIGAFSVDGMVGVVSLVVRGVDFAGEEVVFVPESGGEGLSVLEECAFAVFLVVAEEAFVVLCVLRE